MLYLGIDQHTRQMTISLLNENGDVEHLICARRFARPPLFSHLIWATRSIRPLIPAPRERHRHGTGRFLATAAPNDRFTSICQPELFCCDRATILKFQNDASARHARVVD